MAFSAGAIVSQLTLDRSKFSASMRTVQKQTKQLGGWVKKNSAQFKRMGMVAAAAGAAVLVVFKKMTKQYVETGDMIHKMAIRTSFAATTLSELAFAAEISGADITMLEKGTKKMAKTISDASDGLETYLRVFRKLGLNIEDLLEMSPEEQFFKIGAAIADMENVTLRTAAAVDVFGRSGTMLLPFFKEGAEGIARLRKEAHTLGIIFDEEAAAKAAALKDAQTALTGSVKGLSISILNDLIPVLTDLTKGLTEWFIKNRKHAVGWATTVLKAFELIAKGIETLSIAWDGLKIVVFAVSAAIVDRLIQIAKGIQLIAKASPALTFGFKLIKAENFDEFIKNLTIVSEGYREEVGKGTDAITKTIAKYEAFVATLDKVKTGLNKVKKEQKELATVTTDAALPAARDMTGVLEGAQETLKSYAFATKEVSETQQHFTDLAIANFANMEASMAGFVDAMLSTLEQLAIGEIIPKVMAALPFPINLLAVGGAILAIKTLFKGIRGLAGGGDVERGEPVIVGERGPEIFAPGQAGQVIPMREGMLGKGISLSFNPVFYLSTLDPQTARDVVRDQIGPELLEMFKTKIMLPEFQDALKIT